MMRLPIWMCYLGVAVMLIDGGPFPLIARAGAVAGGHLLVLPLLIVAFRVTRPDATNALERDGRVP